MFHMPPKMPDEKSLTIGAIATRAGIRVSAIRYYETRGLIPTARRAGGRRIYDESVFESIALVQLAQDAGFTLAETRALVAGFAPGTPASARWQAMARRKLSEIIQRIAQAERMKGVLEGLLRCRCESLDQCVRHRAAAMRTARAYLDERPHDSGPTTRR